MARRRRVARPHAPVDRSEEAPDSPRDERLQKVLAAAGIASRRECEELIEAGRVEVDKKTVTALGTKVDPLRSEIRVDGVTLPQPNRVYYALNKPPGVVCTNFDPSGRARVVDMIPTEQRIFPVGRLDRTSEGLILVTNDGMLANRLTHPRFGVKKTYQAFVAGSPSLEDIDLLRRGIRLAEGWARAESVRLRRKTGKSCELIIVLREGRNREIRRMLARIEHKVLRLRRISVGPILLGDLPLGAYRKLTTQEVEALEEDVRQSRRELRQKRKAKAQQPTGEATTAEPPKATQNRPAEESRHPRRELPKRDARQRPKPAPKPPVEHPPQLRISDDDDGPLDDDDFPLVAEESSDEGGYEVQRRGGRPKGGRPKGGRAFAGRPQGGQPLGGKPREGSPHGGRPSGGRPSGGRPSGGRPSGGRPSGGRPSGGRPSGGRPSGGRPSGGRPSGDRPSGDRPSGGRPSGGRPSGGRPSGGRPSGGRPSGGRPSGGRPSGGRPSGGRPSGGRPSGGRPSGGRPSGGRPSGGRPSGGRPSGGRPSGGKPRGGRPTGGKPRGGRP